MQWKLESRECWNRHLMLNLIKFRMPKFDENFNWTFEVDKFDEKRLELKNINIWLKKLIN